MQFNTPSSFWQWSHHQHQQFYVVPVAFLLILRVNYGISIHDSYVGRIHFLQSSAADLGAERESLVFAIGAFAELKSNGDGKQCLHRVPLGARVVSGGWFRCPRNTPHPGCVINYQGYGSSFTCDRSNLSTYVFVVVRVVSASVWIKTWEWLWIPFGFLKLTVRWSTRDCCALATRA